jgi:hypothetical protein
VGAVRPVVQTDTAKHTAGPKSRLIYNL